MIKTILILSIYLIPALILGIELRLIANAIAQTQNAATGESNLVRSDEQQYVTDLLTKIRNAQA